MMKLRRKKQNLLTDRRGELIFGVLGFFALLLLLTIIFGEIFKANSMYDQLDDQLNRGVNLAVKTAMYDSYRQDKKNKMDVDVAKREFYNYLHNDMKLNNALEKLSAGQEPYAYKLIIKDQDVKVDDNARMTVKATAYVPIMGMASMQWELPITVKSRNMRVDGL